MEAHVAYCRKAVDSKCPRNSWGGWWRSYSLREGFGSYWLELLTRFQLKRYGAGKDHVLAVIARKSIRIVKEEVLEAKEKNVVVMKGDLVLRGVLLKNIRVFWNVFQAVWFLPRWFGRNSAWNPFTDVERSEGQQQSDLFAVLALKRLEAHLSDSGQRSLPLGGYEGFVAHCPPLYVQSHPMQGIRSGSVFCCALFPLSWVALSHVLHPSDWFQLSRVWTRRPLLWDWTQNPLKAKAARRRSYWNTCLGRRTFSSLLTESRWKFVLFPITRVMFGKLRLKDLEMGFCYTKINGNPLRCFLQWTCDWFAFGFAAFGISC